MSRPLSPLILSSACLLTLLVPGAAAQSSPATPGLDGFITAQMAAGHLPGLEAVIVKNGRIVWDGAYGLADIGRQRPVTPDTLFQLASVSKTVTATALMQLFDLGAFGLDDDVSGALSFPVVHPNFATTPITFRHLLTHTAGFEDNWSVMAYTVGNSPWPLGWFCEQYIVPGGRLSDPNDNWIPFQPGTHYSYSNFGFALNGHLVESLSKMDFEDYCQANLFQPLGMQETSWRLAKLDPTHIAHPYGWTGSGYVDYGFYGYPDYPDGCLRTSARQLASFMLAHMAQGTYGGYAMLLPGTPGLMTQVQLPTVEASQGLAFYWKTIQGQPVVGHNGGDQGVQTEFWMRPWDGQTGVILLTNGDSGNQAVTRIVERLFREAILY
ncbi:MAG: beta-lactamase family protein [Planctomycetes bacterium]|nr:beta-lactamase family protein [Planctomycetota bacterium]